MVDIIKIIFLALLVYFAWVGVRTLRDLNEQNDRIKELLKLYRGIKEIDIDKL